MIENSIIYDNGSQTLKFGVGNQNSYPTYILQNCLGILKSQYKNNPIYIDEFVTDDEAMFKKTFYKIYEPIQSQSIINFDHFQTIFESVSSKNLNLPYENQPLIFTNPMNDQKELNQLKELFFEYYDIPQILIQRQEILGYFASYEPQFSNPEKQNALLINSGFQKTSIIPMIKGKIKTSTENENIPLIKEINKGGRDITQYFLNNASSNFNKNFEETQNLIEYFSFFQHDNLNININELGISDEEQKQEILNLLEQSNTILFSDDPQQNIVDQIINILQECDEKEKESLLENIILMGGNTSSYLYEIEIIARLKIALESDILSDKINLQVLADRKYLAYNGAYNICSRPQIYQSCFLTKSDYLEQSW